MKFSLLGLLVVAGAAHDIGLFRLPNWLTLEHGTAWLCLGWLLSVPSVTFRASCCIILAALLMLVAGMLAFRFHMLGGGDVKVAGEPGPMGRPQSRFERAFLVADHALRRRAGGDPFLFVGKFRAGLTGSGGQAAPALWGRHCRRPGVDFWIRRSHLGQAFVAGCHLLTASVHRLRLHVSAV